MCGGMYLQSQHSGEKVGQEDCGFEASLSYIEDPAPKLNK